MVFAFPRFSLTSVDVFATAVFLHVVSGVLLPFSKSCPFLVFNNRGLSDLFGGRRAHVGGKTPQSLFWGCARVRYAAAAASQLTSSGAAIASLPLAYRLFLELCALVLRPVPGWV